MTEEIPIDTERARTQHYVIVYANGRGRNGAEGGMGSLEQRLLVAEATLEIMRL